MSFIVFFAEPSASSSLAEITSPSSAAAMTSLSTDVSFSSAAHAAETEVKIINNDKSIKINFLFNII